jgi:uncharacterized membrane protein YraQ (UPF0718 family)
MFFWKDEWKPLALIAGLFLACFFLPIGEQPAGAPRFNNAVMESLHLTKWYAQEHVLLCLVPAFFIAGAISVFVSQASVMKYLGAKANKIVAYGVASVSGTILAVCSCTVLPLFAGIYRMGAGLGPACAFLYSGPAISMLAIVLSARILGLEIGTARGIAAVFFSLIIGILMAFIFRKEEQAKIEAQAGMPEPEVKRPLWKNALFFFSLVGVLVFANWGAPRDVIVEYRQADGTSATVAATIEKENAQQVHLLLEAPEGAVDQKRPERTVARSEIASIEMQASFWKTLFLAKWWVTAAFAVLLGVLLVAWFEFPAWKIGLAGAAPLMLVLLWPHLPEHWAHTLHEFKALSVFAVAAILFSWAASTQEGEPAEWFGASWTLAKQILPLLLGGVLVSGLLLGRPDHEGWIPNAWVSTAVGGDSLLANFVSSIIGAFMYFATLTEVPIVQGLLGSGMGQGPALTLLLAGPALSLPSMLVIQSVMGTKKTVVFVLLVVVLSTFTGWVYGMW